MFQSIGSIATRRKMGPRLTGFFKNDSEKLWDWAELLAAFRMEKIILFVYLETALHWCPQGREI